MAQRSTKPYCIRKSIPAIFFVGMLFFCAQSPAQPLDLSTALFEQESFKNCRTECKRAMLQQTEPRERFELMHTLCGAQLQIPADQTIAALKMIIQQNRDPQVSAIASYELGRQLWAQNLAKPALSAFAHAFHSTTDKSLFLHAACSAFLLLNENRALKAEHPDLVDQINSSRAQWFGQLFSDCAKPDFTKKSDKKPNALVRFYRYQISPAIGSRCTLEPSCSEYFNQAWQKHGPLAVPMVADRFFREPGVNDAHKNPILKHGHIRFGDPVTDHDFWMKK